jgi:hypothetical protein
VPAPHDAPSLIELVTAVREWIDKDVLAGTEGRLQFHARVASNMLAMVEREIAVGADQADAHQDRLARLGVADDAELAESIRDRTFDGDPVLLRALLRESIVDKLAVANPRYLEPGDTERRRGAVSVTG